MAYNRTRSSAHESPPCCRQLSLFPEPFPCRALRGLLLIAEGLALAMADSEIEEWVPLVAAELSRRGLHPDTETKYAKAAIRLTAWLKAEGVTDWSQVTAQHIDDWAEATNPRGPGGNRRPKPGTVRGRQTAAYAFLSIAEHLGAPIRVRAMSAERIPAGQGGVAARPLTAQEADWLRRSSRSVLVPSPRQALVGTAFSGATNKDLAVVRRRDFDFDAGTVRLAGEFERTNKMRKRDADMVRRYLEYDTALGDDGLLCMAGGASSPKAARSVGERLHLSLRGAGLSYVPGVSVRSIRLTGAQRVLRRSGLVAAARYMGSPTLDAAAAALRCDWRRGDA